MPSAENEAAAALRASMSINQGQQHITDESRVLLADLLEERMRVAVAEGIAAAMTDENARRFFAMFLEVAQEQAAKQAGLLVWGGVKRLLMAGTLATLVWVLAGPTAAKLVLAAFNKGA